MNDDDFDRLEATYFDDNGIRLRPPPHFVTCPGCFRRIRHARFLRRPFWREDGDAICHTCIVDEQNRITDAENLRGDWDYWRKTEAKNE